MTQEEVAVFADYVKGKNKISHSEFIAFQKEVCKKIKVKKRIEICEALYGIKSELHVNEYTTLKRQDIINHFEKKYATA